MSDERDNEDPRDPAVSRLYADLPRAEPPAHLDAAILAAARKEIDSGRRAAKPRPFSHWQTLAAVAAVVVLSLLLVPALLDEEQLAYRTLEQERREAADGLMSEAGKGEPAEEATPSPEGMAAGKPAAPSSFAVEPPAAPSVVPERATGSMELRKRQSAGGMQREQRPARAPALFEPKSEMADVARVAPSLEERLAEIRRLVGRGEIALAKSRLESLREAYPDAVIEPELLEQLGLSPEARDAPSPAVK